MKILAMVTNLFDCIYGWISSCIDDISDKIMDIVGGALYLVFA